MTELKSGQYFKTITIPEKILIDSQLSVIDKVFLSVIYTVDPKGCCIPNEVFMRIGDVKKRSVQLILRKLRRSGYIKTSVIEGKRIIITKKKM